MDSVPNHVACGGLSVTALPVPKIIVTPTTAPTRMSSDVACGPAPTHARCVSFETKPTSTATKQAEPPEPAPPSKSSETLSKPAYLAIERPPLNRFFSLPIRSPSRQHFRLKNPVPHQVKETPSIDFLENQNGRFINQYQIIRTIGRGSFGTVYQALDKHGQTYAVKECSKARLAKLNRGALMRLRKRLVSGLEADTLEVPLDTIIHREIAVMKKLDHPNLVTLYEVLDHPTSLSLVLVLEWCPQGSVMPCEQDYDGKAEPIPEWRARLYFRDLVLGVEYLHARGVCHRDIKADNVLLSDGVLKIADFGVSEVFELSSSDVVKRPVGSPAYMSPELVALKWSHPANAPVSGRKTDIWAMGVTLYYMLRGRLPFESCTIDGLQNAILEQDPDLTLFPEDLTDLLVCIFRKDPDQRISLDGIRGHPWVTQNGSDPLLPKEENVQTKEADVITEDDIRDAIEQIEHTGVKMNYLDVSRSLRNNHGWRGDGTRSGSQTPRNINDSESMKMEKLQAALMELNERRSSSDLRDRQ